MVRCALYAKITFRFLWFFRFWQCLNLITQNLLAIFVVFHGVLPHVFFANRTKLLIIGVKKCVIFQFAIFHGIIYTISVLSLIVVLFLAGFQVISVNYQITSKKKMMAAIKQARTIIFLLVVFFISQRTVITDNIVFFYFLTWCEVLLCSYRYN